MPRTHTSGVVLSSGSAAGTVLWMAEEIQPTVHSSLEEIQVWYRLEGCIAPGFPDPPSPIAVQEHGDRVPRAQLQAPQHFVREGEVFHTPRSGQMEQIERSFFAEIEQQDLDLIVVKQEE